MRVRQKERRREREGEREGRRNYKLLSMSYFRSCI